MKDLKTPELAPLDPPRLTRDQAAAAWFTYISTTYIMRQQPNPAMQLMATAILRTAVNTANKVRGLPSDDLQQIIQEHAQSQIISGGT